MRPRSRGHLLACPVRRCCSRRRPPPYQSDFPPEEFQARWKAVFDRIGDRAVAIVQGAPKANGFLVPAPDQRVLPPLRDRDAARLPDPGWQGPQGDALPAPARRRGWRVPRGRSSRPTTPSW